MSADSVLRPIEPGDFDDVLTLNEQFVELLSPMDADRLNHILEVADRACVISHQGRFAGFVITLLSGADYDSDNYRWFAERYDEFYYLDRVVLSPDLRRLGLGSVVYDELEARARELGCPRFALEVNVDPPNHASLAFHDKRGFRPVNEHEAWGHQVQLMVKDLRPVGAGRLSARDLLDQVLDPGSWRSWDEDPVEPAEADSDYAAELERARSTSGVDEAILSGEGLIRGRRVAVVAGEFAFLAGSIGMAASVRLINAVRRATDERLPLLAAPCSGGTRMQEGTAAFVEMVRISAAVAQHKAAGLSYLVYLRHPTTGGVLASWASLGHITVAEPGALVGFLGPRVYRALYGEPFPEGVQTAENLYAHGIVDAVVPPEQIADIVDRALAILTSQPSSGVPDPEPEPIPDVDAWDAVTRSRDPARPGVRRLLKHAATDVIPLNGTGEGEADPGLLIALARFEDVGCVVLGQDRRRQSGRPLGPGALREARRGMRLAVELGLPLLSVVDTPGAALSAEAEEGGLAGEIARCLADLTTLSAPTLCLLLGQGSGGGALALLPADRVVAAQHAWLAPLPPEGASAIVHRDTGHADELARAQGITAADLLRSGVVDRVVAEHPDAAQEPEEFCRRVGAVLRAELARIAIGDDRDTRRGARRARLAGGPSGR